MLTIYYGHRVMPGGTKSPFGPDPNNIISSETFGNFVASLGIDNAVHPDELDVNAIAERDGKTRFLLTFDDGYLDNLTQLLPILERLDLPVMIFVTTGFIGDAHLPHGSRLTTFLMRHDEVRSPGGDWRALSTNAEKAVLYLEMKRRLKPLTHQRREELLKLVVARDGTNAADARPPERLMLTREEVQRLDRHPLVRIGAHAHRHLQLNAVPIHVAYNEMARGKRDLETILGHPVVDFAYPYGAHRRPVRWLARLCGFKRAFTTEQRPITDMAAELSMQLPRFDLVKAAGRE